MAGERLRLFVATSIPAERLEALDASLAPLKGLLPEARWNKAANQHITLKFLGWVDATRRYGLSEPLAAAARLHEPAEIRLTSLGAFPSERSARVVWVGLDDPAGRLAALAATVDASLEPLGFEREQRPFRAHLTVARLNRPQSVAELMAQPFPEGAPFVANNLALYRSHLLARGASYEVLERFALGQEV